MAFLWTAPCRATFCQGTGRFDWQGAAIIGYRPADHGRVPRLAALHVGETLHRLNCDGAARCKPIASRHTYRTMKSSASSQLTWRHVFVRRSSPLLGGTVLDCQNLVGAAVAHAQEPPDCPDVLVAVDTPNPTSRKMLDGKSWDTWPARLWYCQWSWPSPPQAPWGNPIRDACRNRRPTR